MPQVTSATQPSRLALNAAIAAVLMSSLLVVAKSWVWLQGGSAAVLASMVDSLIDALISFTNLLAIRYAGRPADDDHRYGHGKMEGIAALAQAAFIGGSCVFVLLESARVFGNPAPVGAVDMGVAVLLLATLSTLVLTRYQAYAARNSHSLAVEADAAHYTGDIAINVGVMASLLAGRYLGWLWIDPAVALLVAGWLLYNARAVGMKAVDMLLDRELEEPLRADMLRIIRATPGVEGVHDLRTRRSGAKLMVSFDIEVEPTLTLDQAHNIARAVEAGLLAAHPRAEVMIHLDPRGDITDSRHRRIKDFHVR